MINDGGQGQSKVILDDKWGIGVSQKVFFDDKVGSGVQIPHPLEGMISLMNSPLYFGVRWRCIDANLQKADQIFKLWLMLCCGILLCYSKIVVVDYVLFCLHCIDLFCFGYFWVVLCVLLQNDRVFCASYIGVICCSLHCGSFVLFLFSLTKYGWSF